MCYLVLCTRIGKRKFKFTHRKNEEHRKYGQQPELQVSILLEHISVSKFCTPEPESLVVSYALSNVQVRVNSLCEQLSCTRLPIGVYVGSFFIGCTFTCTFHCFSLTPTLTQCLTPLFSGWTTNAVSRGCVSMQAREDRQP